MNTKLTLSLNKNSIKRAKMYADQQGTSLSKIVANYFDELTKNYNGKDIKPTPLVKRLGGALKGLKIVDFDEAKTEYLTKKYQK